MNINTIGIGILATVLGLAIFSATVSFFAKKKETKGNEQTDSKN